jgi:hypothetical protein
MKTNWRNVATWQTAKLTKMVSGKILATFRNEHGHFVSQKSFCSTAEARQVFTKSKGWK